MARNYIRLSNIVNNWLLTRDEDDYDKNMNKVQAMTFGKECVRDEIAISLNAYVRSLLLPINKDLMTVQLPEDYIDYTKIGVVDNCGKVQVLGLNNKINTAGSVLLDDSGENLLDSDGVPLSSEKEVKECTSQSENYDTGYIFHNYGYNGEFNGRIFGLGGGHNARGYYRINKEDNRIELDLSIDTDELLLEYVADETLTADPLVPVHAEKMVRDWIYFRAIQRKTNVPQSAVQMAERRYFRSKTWANFTMKMFTKSELAQQINRRFQLAPKFLYE